MLSSEETRAAEALLGHRVISAEKIWDRGYILRLSLGDGRSAVLKRRRSADSADHDRSFLGEAAALSFLQDMPVPVAPRLLGFDGSLLIMEDLGPESSLAHSLLAGDPVLARDHLVAYARALGAMHAWSSGRGRAFASLAGPDVPQPYWLRRLEEHTPAFLSLLARLGLPGGDRMSAEIDSLVPLMHGPGDAYAGLTHSDPCPDNTYVPLGGGDCRIFDFETAGWGPVALDFGYLLAPFPSCWCFAFLPDSAVDPAVAAYREVMADAGVTLGPAWDVAVTAALAAVVIARAPMLTDGLGEDRDWGTTSARPRLLTWLASFVRAAGSSGALPHLRAAASAMHGQFASRWPEAAAPDYPALARPGATLGRIPKGWTPAGG